MPSTVAVAVAMVVVIAVAVAIVAVMLLLDGIEASEQAVAFATGTGREIDRVRIAAASTIADAERPEAVDGDGAFMFALEETVETTQDMHALDVAPPSLPELMSIPVDTDFVIPPLPPAPETLGPKVAQFVIPQSAGRSVAPAGQKIFNLSELDKVPQVLQSFSPTYPLELMRSHVAGLVVVQFIVDPQGDVQDVKIVSSPHQLLGLAVKRAISRWRFRPGMKAGRAVNTTMELPVEFTPEGN